MSTLKTNTIQHLTSGFNNVVQFVDGAGTQNGTLCRAWVNFNGTSTVAIRAQFNVTSITDNGTGDYTVNFSNAMSDANYAAVGMGGPAATNTRPYIVDAYSYSTGSLAIASHLVDSSGPGFYYDNTNICIAVFR